MAKERSAIATIKGYYYQFDYFILQLLKCNNETDSICIEGIEDVDLKTVDESTAIQCKYYAGTVVITCVLKSNPSKVSKIILTILP